MTRRPFSTSPSYSRYIRGIRDIHALIATDRDDSPEADAIRDGMDHPWYDLSETEQARLKGLSADLYSISDPPQEPQPTDHQFGRTLMKVEEARRAGEWDRALEILRSWSHQIDPQQLSRSPGHDLARGRRRRHGRPVPRACRPNRSDPARVRDRPATGKSPMKWPRISILGLIAAVVACGVAFAALRGGSGYWLSAFYTMTVAFLLGAVVLARYGRGTSRAFWFGFAVFGWGMFFLGANPWETEIDHGAFGTKRQSKTAHDATDPGRGRPLPDRDGRHGADRRDHREHGGHRPLAGRPRCREPRRTFRGRDEEAIPENSRWSVPPTARMSSPR